MDEFISANPCNFDHSSLFEMVQRLTLDHRLNDSYSCLVTKLSIQFCSVTGIAVLFILSCIITFALLKLHFCVWLCSSGLVQSRSGVCIRWVLRQVRSARVSQAPVLPEWPAGEGRERVHDRPHTTALQLRLLRLPRARQQVPLISHSLSLSHSVSLTPASFHSHL